jgi:hypothetical protein
MATSNPAAASATTMLLPIPEAEPVTSATFRMQRAFKKANMFGSDHDRDYSV